MTPITIEPMTRALLPQVVAVHEEAFPDFFLTELGHRFLRLYYSALIESEIGVALVAVVEGGGVLGFAAGSTEPAGFYRRLLRSRWMSFGLAAMPTVFRHPSRLGRVLAALRHPSRQPAEPGTAGLHSLATSPSAQGSGVGGALVDAFIGVVSSMGCTRVRLETDAAGNERVLDFYDRRGFRVVGEESRADRRMLLMEKAITSEE